MFGVLSGMVSSTLGRPLSFTTCKSGGYNASHRWHGCRTGTARPGRKRSGRRGGWQVGAGSGAEGGEEHRQGPISASPDSERGNAGTEWADDLPVDDQAGRKGA